MSNYAASDARSPVNIMLPADPWPVQGWSAPSCRYDLDRMRNEVSKQEDATDANGTAFNALTKPEAGSALARWSPPDATDFSVPLLGGVSGNIIVKDRTVADWPFQGARPCAVSMARTGLNIWQFQPMAMLEQRWPMRGRPA